MYAQKTPKILDENVSTETLIERAFSPVNGKIDILFIYPPLAMSGRDFYHHRLMLPLGIACLAAYLRDQGFEVLAYRLLLVWGYLQKRYLRSSKENSLVSLPFSSTTYTLKDVMR